MSRGLVIGVLIGAGGATAFWRMRMQELAQRKLLGTSLPAPAPASTRVVEPAPVLSVETSTTSSRTETVTDVPAGPAGPAEHSTAQSPVNTSSKISSAPPSAGAAIAARPAQDAKSAELSSAESPDSSSLVTSSAPHAVDAKNTALVNKTMTSRDALVNKFMAKMVIPKLHSKVKEVFCIDEGLKEVRVAEQKQRPQIFVELGEKCFAQLLVALQAFCLLKLLVALKVSYATRSGKPKLADKTAVKNEVKQDISAAVDKFLQHGLASLVVR